MVSGFCDAGGDEKAVQVIVRIAELTAKAR